MVGTRLGHLNLSSHLILSTVLSRTIPTFLFFLIFKYYFIYFFIQQVLISHQFYAHQCIHVSPNLQALLTSSSLISHPSLAPVPSQATVSRSILIAPGSQLPLLLSTHHQCNAYPTALEFPANCLATTYQNVYPREQLPFLAVASYQAEHQVGIVFPWQGHCLCVVLYLPLW